MSSSFVRTEIKSFLGTNAPTENLIDFSAEYRDVDDIIDGNGLTDEDPFLGIQFLPSDESPIGMISDNGGGCYRERGVILLHIVEVISTTHRDDILARAETLLGLFRGATINGEIIIESLAHANFDSSATLNFERGYEAASITVNFYRNYNF